jgi:hypothetical protein
MSQRASIFSARSSVSLLINHHIMHPMQQQQHLESFSHQNNICAPSLPSACNQPSAYPTYQDLVKGQSSGPVLSPVLRTTLSLICGSSEPGLLLADHYLSKSQQLKCSPVLSLHGWHRKLMPQLFSIGDCSILGNCRFDSKTRSSLQSHFLIIATPQPADDSG